MKKEIEKIAKVSADYFTNDFQQLSELIDRLKDPASENTIFERIDPANYSPDYSLMVSNVNKLIKKHNSTVRANGSATAHVESLNTGSENHRRTLLIADDDHLSRELLKEMLMDEYDVLEASDGEEALEIIREHYTDISLILLDLVMPKCSGYEVLKIVQASEQYEMIPIIVASSCAEQEAQVLCMELGAVDFLQKPYNAAIIKCRVKNVLKMRELILSYENLETDELTGLYNRRAFLSHAQSMIDANPNVSYDLLVCDIRNFKQINLVYDENIGDEILKLLGDFMLSNTPTGICARYGADQFASIVKTPPPNEGKWLTKKMGALCESAPVDHLTVKVGVYEKVDHSLSVANMCDRAMMALNSIKSDYAKDVALFDGPLCQKMMQAQEYETRFPEAIQHGEFEVWYQPKFDGLSKKVVGAEALVRWRKADGTLISPSNFLNIFEKNGMIIQLDEYVFRTVCRQQKQWMEQGKKLVPISVNLSRRSMYQSKISECYQKITDEYGIKPYFVPIEITESAAIDYAQIKPLADAFFRAGFSLHMDDFGSGQSSLNGLNLLHFEIIKLDKSLVDFIGDPQGDLLLRYTMALATELGLHLVAEGVENEKQLSFLHENGCDTIQGFYFSKPLPVDQFEEKVNRCGILDESERQYLRKFALTEIL